MLTITTRLTFWYLAVFGTILIVICIAIYTARDSWERSVIDGEMRNFASLLADKATIDSATVTPRALFNEYSRIASNADLRYRSMSFLLATPGTAFYDDTLLNSLDNDLRSANARRVAGSDYVTTWINGAEYRGLIVPMKIRDADLSLVIIASLTPLEERLWRLQKLFFIVIPAALLIASIGGWFMARRALRPVSEIANAAALISSTSLHQRVPVGTMRDELSQLAKTFNDMIARLEQNFTSQRRFVADASHDLRTPITILQAELELLLQRKDLDAQTRDGLERAAAEVDRLSRLANDLLLLAKVDAQQLRTVREPFRLDELVVESVRQLSTLAARKKIALRVTINDPVELVGDAHMLSRALTNVMDNAIKYTPEHGVVAVNLTETAENVTIHVHDTGAGIDPHDLDKVFERFYRTDRSRSTAGSGLGLAIARAIVDTLGGCLTISSRVGVGTSVQIALPR